MAISSGRPLHRANTAVTWLGVRTVPWPRPVQSSHPPARWTPRPGRCRPQPSARHQALTSLSHCAARSQGTSSASTTAHGHMSLAPSPQCLGAPCHGTPPRHLPAQAWLWLLGQAAQPPILPPLCRWITWYPAPSPPTHPVLSLTAPIPSCTLDPDIRAQGCCAG